MTRNLVKEKRIESVLHCAMVAFLKNGYENTTVDMIAHKAHLSKGGLYHHFTSKDEILIGVCNMLNAPIEKIIDETSKIHNPIKALKYFILEYLTYWNGHKQELSLIMLKNNRIISDENFRKYYDNSLENFTAFLEKLYQNAIARKKIKKANAGSMALSLFASLEGILYYLAIEKTLLPEELAEQFYNTFINLRKE